jgi:hypothetical protein
MSLTFRQRIARANGQKPAQAGAAEADQANKEADFAREKMYDASAFANNAETRMGNRNGSHGF